MDRALREFRIRGVKTNIPFLENVVNHADVPGGRRHHALPGRHAGAVPVHAAADRATKLLTYLGDVIVNGNPEVAGKPKPAHFAAAPVPPHDPSAPPARHAAAADRARAGEVRRVDARAEAPAAHRHDVPRRAPVAARHARAHLRHAGDRELRRRTGCTICSASRCGAARPSTSRCASCRRIRGSACGSCAKRFRTSASRCCCAPRTRSATRPIPTTSSQEFIYEAAAQGIDIFRIFDSLNWLPNMKVAMEAVRKTRRDLRSRDLLHGRHSRSEARQVLARVLRPNGEGTGAHGRARPRDQGHGRPVQAVRGRETGARRCARRSALPIHFHTHDTSGINAASILKAADAGVDVADGAIASMSGTTSQPNLNSIVAALHNTPRDTGLDLDALNECDDYWEIVRTYYAPFDSGSEVGHGGGLSARDARRPVHEPAGAGRSRWASARAGRRSRARMPT